MSAGSSSSTTSTRRFWVARRRRPDPTAVPSPQRLRGRAVFRQAQTRRRWRDRARGTGTVPVLLLDTWRTCSGTSWGVVIELGGATGAPPRIRGATLARRVVHAGLALISLRSTSRPPRPPARCAGVNPAPLAALADCLIIARSLCDPPRSSERVGEGRPAENAERVGTELGG